MKDSSRKLFSSSEEDDDVVLEVKSADVKEGTLELEGASSGEKKF